MGKLATVVVLTTKPTTLVVGNSQGKWSIDIMKVEDQFYLIDMALANQSYYYEENDE